ncbi:MAG TPA: hypothetical protein VHG10_15490 [Glycomyces sp.]|nr:hypothetical protein [Glycomyces sp.]
MTQHPVQPTEQRLSWPRIILYFTVFALLLLGPPIWLGVSIVRGVQLMDVKAGEAGAAGTVTVERVVTVESGRDCYGTFMPDDGGTSIEGVEIKMKGFCREGDQSPARLDDALWFQWEPRAWTPGARYSEAWAPVAVAALFSLPGPIGVLVLRRHGRKGR